MARLQAAEEALGTDTRGMCTTVAFLEAGFGVLSFWWRRGRLVLGWTLCAFSIVGCGGEARPSQIKGLPKQQLRLVPDLCPSRGDTSSASSESVADAVGSRRRAQAELRQLERAYRADPEATVRTAYLPSEEAGLKYETITIRRLAEIELKGASEVIEVGDGGSRRCARGAEKRLRRLSSDTP